MCESSSSSRRIKRDIVDIILSWSYRDITNQDLLKDKVRSIPTEFSSVDHYLESFRYPLIEETREELSKRFWAISEAPYVGIIVDRCNVVAGSAHDGDTIFSFSLYFSEQKGNYEPRIGDIVLLSTFLPKDMEDLQEVMSLAVINKIGDVSGRHCEGKLGTVGSKEILGGGVSYMAIYLINVNEINRLWMSLNMGSDDLRMHLIKKILCYSSLVNKSCSSSQIEDIFEEKIINRLNQSQIGVVRSVVSDIRSNLSSVHCISGLPGTGKSETCRIITLAAISLKLKVIVCGPDEFSVIDIPLHFRKLVEGSQFQYILRDIVAYGGNDEKQVDVTGVRLLYCPVSKLSSLGEMESHVVVIVENATQLKECDSIVLLQLKGLQHVILVGDEYDLPSTVSSKLSANAGFGRSLFERLRSFCRPKQLLNIQYRMHPAISLFPNKRLFIGQLCDDLSVIDRGHFKYKFPEHIYTAYSFIDINDGKEVMNGQGDDFTNIVEAALVVKIVTKLFHEYVNSRKELSIGVISPYGAQVQTIQDMLPERIKPNSDFSLWVRSSDGVHNCEVDVIIISTVRCNGSGSVGRLCDQNLTNMSLTRARHCLWIVGSGKTLVKSESIWQDLVLDATERGCMFHVGEDKELAGVVLNVKRELDELDDLLNQESLLFKDKIWKIIFSDDFKQSFVALKSLFMKQIVIGFLLRIATGWRPKHRCLYSLSPSLRDFVKLYKVRGLYLVCTIEIVSDSQFTQALRIWDVLPLVEIPKLVAKIEEMMTVCSHYYRERCMKEKRDGNLFVPISWNICADYAKYNCAPTLPGLTTGSQKSNGLESSKLSGSLLLMKFYSLSSLSVKNLLQASDGKELELPFEVSDAELEIINFPRSAFVLGRSGTGKTIVSILKLMRREQEYMDALQGTVSLTNSRYPSQNWDCHIIQGNGLRQIFVTVSANLCSAVKAYITRLKRCISKADSEDTEMHEVGDSLSMFADIPDSFIDITRSHFPLVISLHKFLLMLDGSMRFSYFDRFQDLRLISDARRSGMSHTKLQLLRAKEVRYERFLASYWPSFNVNYTKKLDPLLVFTQIVTFIKGGCRLGKAAQHEEMNEEEYISLSDSRMSTISKEKRQMIYKIFLDYEKKKLYNWEYDISDLVIDIHRRLTTEGYGGELMDFIYIDEVQDFSLNQLSLFKYISCNVKEGFVFSGDTAQTITKGVDFRFEEIRSLFYTEFLHRKEKLNDLFQLHQNFRTHSAVLKLAQSVLTLLYYFFPYSFDKLEAETSILDGEVPLLLESCDEDVLKNIFCSSTGNKDGLVTFGAQQVILVRDDTVKKQVIDQIGSSALVLTILECKGLEFQDVLLYNFFEKSPLGNKWRVVYNYMADENLLGSSTLQNPKFDQELHGALCAELKELYVAITRTRQRFWIFEKSSVTKPLFDYWKKLGVVNCGECNLSFAGNMQVFCKPEEWKLRGEKFFNEGDYRTASFCFKRSGDVFRSNWAKAAALQMDGENNLRRDFGFASECLSEAAELYERIGKLESVAACFMTLKDYAKASEIYLKKFPKPRYEDAGDCLAVGGLWSDAANIYAKGNCLLKCMSACRKGELFELGWVLLKKWPRIDVTDNKMRLLNDWISKINKNSDIKSVTGIVREFPEDAYSFLLEKGKYTEAASLQRMVGNTLTEAKVFERAKDYHKSSQLVLFHIAVQFLMVEKSRVTEPYNLQVLKEKAKELSYEISNSYGRNVCAELDFLTDSRCRLSNILVYIQKAQNFRNAVMETLAARKVLELYLKLDIGRFSHDLDPVFKWRSNLLEKCFFEGQSSPQVLLSTWNIWMKRISCLFSYLQGSVNTGDQEEYTDLCQKYFLVLKLCSRDVYVAFDRRATWLAGASEQALYRVDNKVYMSGRVFKSLAQHFLREEVSSLCDRLLQILKQIQLNYQQKFTFIQSVVLALQISGVLKFVAVYGSNKRKISGLQNWLHKAFFPLCYNESMLSSKNDSDLQDKDTAMKAVGLVLYANLNSLKSGSMPTRTSWAIAFFFFNSKFIEELTWELRYKYGLDCLWKPFYEELLSFKNMEHKDALSLGKTFLDAVQPIDPHTQVLLLETLLFLTSSCQIGRGWFITSKMMLSKVIFSNDSESFRYALSSPSRPAVVQESIKRLYDFILAVVCDILTNRRFILAKRYDRQDLHFHQSLVLRLISILALVSLNSAGHFVRVQEILRKAAGSILVLPPCFQLGLWNVINGRMRSWKIFGFMFSKALRTIDNRLVLVRLDDYREHRGAAMHLKPIVVNTRFYSEEGSTECCDVD